MFNFRGNLRHFVMPSLLRLTLLYLRSLRDRSFRGNLRLLRSALFALLNPPFKVTYGYYEVPSLLRLTLLYLRSLRDR